jgi:hypothetical protein
VEKKACDLIISALKMEEATYSTAVLTIYHTTCRHAPEGFILNGFRYFLRRSGA